MIYGSLFSGIEGASVAWAPLGWRCAWVAETDAFACAVLRHHYPDTPNLGDMERIDAGTVEPVDLVVGGPPCQDFSVAGQRAGIEGERGKLSLEYVRALDAIDPAWSVTENVPGWLSMGDNAFGRFLAAMVGSGAPLIPRHGQRWTDAGLVAGPKRTAAWRVLDAQFHGVPQRRRRVFVVTVRGAGNWACAEALFPQQQSVPRNFAPRREAGERIARPVASCAPGGSGCRADADTADNLIADTLIAFSAKDHGADAGDIAPTLRAGGHTTSRANAGVMPAICHALRADGFDASEDGTGRGTPLVAVPIQSVQSVREKKQNGKPGQGYPAAMQGMSVRRLTPRECLRLQGFPDDYLDIQYRGKPAADGPKYRGIGNSFAVPVVRWIGQRIQAFEDAVCAHLEAAE